MVEIVRIPRLGLSDYGDLVSWEVAVSEPVSSGDVVAVIESEKASAEIESPADGVLLDTYVAEGEEIPIDVGKPLGVVGADDEAVPSLDEITDAETETAAEADESEPESATAAVSSDEQSESTSESKATPRAKRRAEDEGVDLAAVEGTGPEGAVTEDDVVDYLDSRGGDEGTDASESGGLTVAESRELSGTRKTIADRLSRSAREKPHVMGTREIPIEQLERVRDRLAAEDDVDVSLNDLLLHLVGRVLADQPEFNAHFEDGTHKLVDEVNIGYAVDGPRGLVVPVIDDVTDRSLAELADRREAMVERVLEDDYTAADLEGGTFTVTNVGVFDMDVSYSIINPPEVAILAIGRRKYAPVERDGDVDFEKVVTFSLTIDHRVLDGADSGAFLDRLAEYVENPDSVFETV